LDGSLQLLVVAPTISSVDGGGGYDGNDDYWKMPKGNLDPTGEYFIWTANAGTSRLDAFVVHVPKSKLGGGSPPPTAPAPPAPPPTDPPPTDPAPTDPAPTDPTPPPTAPAPGGPGT